MARQRRQATVLSEGDAAVLRKLIDQAKKLEVGKPPVSVVLQADDTLGRNFQAPEVYIALIPEEGIPGVNISPGVGTGTGLGIGSSLAPGDGDRVSSAFCNIYEILLGLSVGSGVLEEKELVYKGFAEQVYNLSRSTIPTGYAIIQRDKFGQFVTLPGVHPDIYGQAAEDISYGNTPGTIYIWENGVITDPLHTEEVLFNFLGKPGDVIQAWTLLEARWWADLNDGVGAYRVSNSNCDPETSTGTGTG